MHVNKKNLAKFNFILPIRSGPPNKNDEIHIMEGDVVAG